jgi:hypothetical protein
VWMIIISARLLDAVTQPKLRSAPLVIEPATNFQPAEAGYPLKADTLTASILRTHSQCQRGSSRPVITASLRRTVVFIPGKSQWHDDLAKLGRGSARSAGIAKAMADGAGFARGALAEEWWSLSGSNR